MLNKLVHETRGKCWHDYQGHYTHCKKCEALWGDEGPNPDYTNDMNACMELPGVLEVSRYSEDGWRAVLDGPIIGDVRPTPQLAIIHAYLKSKGVELGEDK